MHYFGPVFGEVENGQDGDYADDQTEYDNDGYTDSDEYQGSGHVEDEGYEPDDYGADSSLIDDIAVTDENSSVIINVLSNDQDYFGQENRLELDNVYGSLYGTVTVNSDNTVTYTPSQLRVSSDTVVSDLFYYEASYKNNSSHYAGAVNASIHQVNDAPIVSDSEYSIANDLQFSFYLEGYDEDGDSLEFFIASFDGWGEYTLEPETGGVTYIPLSSKVGEDIFFYGASDGTSTSNFAKITIVTSGSNSEYQEEQEEWQPEDDSDTPSDEESDSDAASGSEQDSNSTDSSNGEPIADAGDDIEVFQGEHVELDGSDSYDPDGDEIAYAWSQVSGPQVSVANSDSANPTFTSPEVEIDITLEFELIVSDGMSTSEPSSITVLVIAPDSDSQSSGSLDSECTGVIIIAGTSASGYEANHPPAHAVDSNPSTRWSENGDGSWINIELEEETDICGVDIAWYKGNIRSSDFIIALSDDGTNFVEVYSDESSGATDSAESYIFSDTAPATHIRIIVNGNTQNDYASITEIAVKGQTT